MHFRTAAPALLFASLAAFPLAACEPAGRTGGVCEIVELTSPAPSGSAEPNLVAAADGSIYLSWLEQAGDESHALKYARLSNVDGDWSAPVAVVARDDLFVNWADFPSLLPTKSGRILAHWLQKSGGAPYAYDVMIAQTADGGATWSQPRVLHDDGLQGEHGFVSLFESPDDKVQAIWLDGRNTIAPDRAP